VMGNGKLGALFFATLESAPVPHYSADFRAHDYLTGNWGRVRTSLEQGSSIIVLHDRCSWPAHALTRASSSAMRSLKGATARATSSAV